MNALLIDIGNSRIKWRYVDAMGWRTDNPQGHAAHAEVAALAHNWHTLASAVEAIHIANVAGPAMLAQITALVPKASTVQVLTPSDKQCGVRNIYAEPERLGADRWAALIAAHAIHPDTACLIVSLGTATTIDFLQADGQFAGGVILPGIATMRRSLAQSTAQLSDAVGHFTILADNTADAIKSGILHAQLGAIERIWKHAQTCADTLQILVSGGDAALVAPLLPFTSRIEDQLVLRGLYEIARSRI